MTQHTSLELSKKLKENGCKLESRYCYGKREDMTIFGFYDDIDLKDLETFCGIKTEESILAYDILYDICIRYKAQFFKDTLMDKDGGKVVKMTKKERKEWESKEKQIYKVVNDISTNMNFEEEDLIRESTKITKKILSMLQQGKDQKEIEGYIWSVCKFNNKNKETK